MAGGHGARFAAPAEPDHGNRTGDHDSDGGLRGHHPPPCGECRMKAARVLAILFLSAVGISALIPRVWTPKNYAAQFREDLDARPSVRFPLGTDALGRDRLARLLYGSRVSLTLAPAAAL